MKLFSLFVGLVFFLFFFSMEFEIKPLLFLESNLYAYVFHK